jgi:hypothetical protein
MKSIQFIFFGIVAALGSLIVELTLTTLFPERTGTSYDSIGIMLVLFVLSEEIFKFALIYKTNLQFKKSLTFFANAGLIGLGFALTEIFLVYLGNTFQQESLSWPVLGIAIVHISTSMLLGLAVFQQVSTKKMLAPAAILLTAALHMFYNSLIIYNAIPAANFAYLAVLCLIPLLVMILNRRQNLPKI